MALAFGDGSRDPLLLWNMAVPFEPMVGNTFDVVERYATTGHDFISLTVGEHDAGLRATLGRIGLLRRLIAEAADRLVLARSPADVHVATASGRMAVGVHLECL